MLNLDKHNRLRERYRQMNPSWRPATETYATLAGPYLDSTTRALDLGCGQGGVVEQQHNPASQITGVDVERLSLAEHRLQSIARVSAAITLLPYSRESYDLALASWLFEHLPHLTQTLQEVYRIFRPGGAIIFFTPDGRHSVTDLNRFLGRRT